MSVVMELTEGGEANPEQRRVCRARARDEFPGTTFVLGQPFWRADCFAFPIDHKLLPVVGAELDHDDRGLDFLTMAGASSGPVIIVVSNQPRGSVRPFDHNTGCLGKSRAAARPLRHRR
jgi:hypothetical protein